MINRCQLQRRINLAVAVDIMKRGEALLLRDEARDIDEVVVGVARIKFSYHLQDICNRRAVVMVKAAALTFVVVEVTEHDDFACGAPIAENYRSDSISLRLSLLSAVRIGGAA